MAANIKNPIQQTPNPLVFAASSKYVIPQRLSHISYPSTLINDTVDPIGVLGNTPHQPFAEIPGFLGGSEILPEEIQGLVYLSRGQIDLVKNL